jgi:hypothetical protein
MNFWYKQKLALARVLRLDLTHAQTHYANFLQSSVKEGAKWLDVGCGGSIVPDWVMPVAQQRTMVSR